MTRINRGLVMVVLTRICTLWMLKATIWREGNKSLMQAPKSTDGRLEYGCRDLLLPIYWKTWSRILVDGPGHPTWPLVLRARINHLRREGHSLFKLVKRSRKSKESCRRKKEHQELITGSILLHLVK